ncbi:MAG: tRNA (adenosine(37)-N6)-threonylcarbamoyltransferase complex transferase subunit TsaD, partial [Candidatus Uhrbacteria bacterium]
FSFNVRSNVVASQVRIHARTGGVVPEVAAREHVERIIPVIERALRDGTPHASRLTSHVLRLGSAIDAIAVTAGPGLITSLAAGVETARALAYAWRKPLVAVNHIEGHVLSALLPRCREEQKNHRTIEQERLRVLQSFSPTALQFPALALIVSGGHTELLLMRGWVQYECIGATRDDAAGEAFDKVGKLLGLSYPGGPAVARAAERGDPTAFDFPRAMLHSGDFEFSFSGLKTAVRYFVAKHQAPSTKFQINSKSRRFGRDPDTRSSGHQIPNSQFIRDVCASFQEAAVDVLVAKTVAAADKYGARSVLLGGGVAANTHLRKQLIAALDALPNVVDCRLPTVDFCGDNAAMMAAAGGVRLLLGQRTRWQDLTADPNWELGRD